jgi:hypothetical protein
MWGCKPNASTTGPGSAVDMAEGIHVGVVVRGKETHIFVGADTRSVSGNQHPQGFLHFMTPIVIRPTLRHSPHPRWARNTLGAPPIYGRQPSQIHAKEGLPDGMAQGGQTIRTTL